MGSHLGFAFGKRATVTHPLRGNSLGGFFVFNCLTMLERSSITTGMKQLTKEQRCMVVRCLVDGCSIRATKRISGVSINTIQKLTRDLGEACLEFQDKVLRKLAC